MQAKHQLQGQENIASLGRINPENPLQQPTYVPVPLPSSSGSGWNCPSCCTLWVGINSLIAGIILIVNGAIVINNVKQYPATLCSYPYTSYDPSSNKCCYIYGSTGSTGFICESLNKDAFRTAGIIVLCIGIVAGIIGAVLLYYSHKFYRNNEARCCS